MSRGRPQESRKTGLHRHLLDSLKRANKRYRNQLGRCQRPSSEEVVHDLRVEIRRLLALVAMIGAFLPERRLRKATRLLKAQLDVLADLRDTQVQALRMRTMARRSAGARRYQAHLARREQRGVRQAAKAIREFHPARVRRLMDRFRAEIRTRRKRGFEAGDWARLRRAVLGSYAQAARLNQRASAADTKTIHRTRIAFKKYRYMIEALAPWLESVSPRDLQAMHNHQTLMGKVQDLEVLMSGVVKFLGKGKQDPRALRALLARLEVQRRAAVSRFLQAADRLSSFAPDRFLDAGPRAD